MKSKLMFLLLPMMLLLPGCGGADREATMIGSWRVRPLAMMMDAVKGSEGMSNQQARAAGQELGGITLEMNADKTFALNGPASVKGTWSFDKESGTATLSPAPAAVPTPDPSLGGQVSAPAKPADISGKLDDDNEPRFTLDLPTSALGTTINVPEIVFEKTPVN